MSIYTNKNNKEFTPALKKQLNTPTKQNQFKKKSLTLKQSDKLQAQTIEHTKINHNTNKKINLSPFDRLKIKLGLIIDTINDKNEVVSVSTYRQHGQQLIISQQLKKNSPKSKEEFIQTSSNDAQREVLDRPSVIDHKQFEVLNRQEEVKDQKDKPNLKKRSSNKRYIFYNQVKVESSQNKSIQDNSHKIGQINQNKQLCNFQKSDPKYRQRINAAESKIQKEKNIKSSKGEDSLKNQNAKDQIYNKGKGKSGQNKKQRLKSKLAFIFYKQQQESVAASVSYYSQTNSTDSRWGVKLNQLQQTINQKEKPAEQIKQIKTQNDKSQREKQTDRLDNHKGESKKSNKASFSIELKQVEIAAKQSPKTIQTTQIKKQPKKETKKQIKRPVKKIATVSNTGSKYPDSLNLTQSTKNEKKNKPKIRQEKPSSYTNRKSLNENESSENQQQQTGKKMNQLQYKEKNKMAQTNFQPLNDNQKYLLKLLKQKQRKAIRSMMEQYYPAKSYQQTNLEVKQEQAIPNHKQDIRYSDALDEVIYEQNWNNNPHSTQLGNLQTRVADQFSVFHKNNQENIKISLPPIIYNYYNARPLRSITEGSPTPQMNKYASQKHKKQFNYSPYQFEPKDDSVFSHSGNYHVSNDYKHKKANRQFEWNKVERLKKLIDQI